MGTSQVNYTHLHRSVLSKVLGAYNADLALAQELNTARFLLHDAANSRVVSTRTLSPCTSACVIGGLDR